MHTGMLWFDDSKTTLKTKIEKAIEYYRKKYGRSPDLCLVHPNMLQGVDTSDLKITVRPYRPVLEGHVWIGIEQK